jgi:hypothetical protein
VVNRIGVRSTRANRRFRRLIRYLDSDPRINAACIDRVLHFECRVWTVDDRFHVHIARYYVDEFIDERAWVTAAATAVCILLTYASRGNYE